MSSNNGSFSVRSVTVPPIMLSNPLLRNEERRRITPQYSTPNYS